MSLRTRAWQKVIGLAQARAGSEFGSGELDRLGLLLNSAAQIINDASPYWPRLLSLQPRSVTNGVVSLSEDSYYIYGAGTLASNGLYVRNGLENTLPKYTKYDTDGTTPLYNIVALDSSGNGWNLESEASAVFYTTATVSTTPPTTGWTVDTGTAPVPVLEDLYDIDECIEVWNGPKWKVNSGEERGLSVTSKMRWYASGSGIRLTNPQEDIVFVGFKRDLTEEYGDGSDGTVSSVPNEWADFMAYHAARSWQDAQAGNFQSQGIALSQITKVLEDQLLKVNRENAMQILSSYIETYYSYDRSIR